MLYDISAIEKTNTDAASSKLSCVYAGYFEDDLLALFCPQRRQRRNPIINKGYYVRVALFRRTIDNFVHSFTDCQILNLGAGSDTNGLLAVRAHPNVTLFEVDTFDSVLSKARVLHAHKDRFAFLTHSDEHFPESPSIDVAHGGEAARWCSLRLKLISHDLRTDLFSLKQKLIACGFDQKKPTLVLSECVLIYLDKEQSDRVLTWIARDLCTAPTLMALYEQVNPSDRFGEVMMENLSQRGCALLSITDTPSSQRTRLEGLKFHGARVELMTHFNKLVPRKTPEIIDELEEFNLLQSHYFFALAWNACTSVELLVNMIMDNDDNA